MICGCSGINGLLLWYCVSIHELSGQVHLCEVSHHGGKGFKSREPCRASL